MAVIPDVRTKIRGYINHNSLERATLKDTLNTIASDLPETVIFGGMIRDFALGSARTFSSDIDLVSLASREDIAKAIACFSPVRNKFGGFRFIRNKQVFDIWAFDDTWAFRQGLAKGTELTDLLKTTFFNVDASAYSLNKDHCIYSTEWSDGIKSRLLDINLSDNPFPERMYLRAIKLACNKDLSIGPKLAEFLMSHLKLQHLDRVGCMFMLGLKKHIEYGINEPYTFKPQINLLP